LLIFDANTLLFGQNQMAEAYNLVFNVLEIPYPGRAKNL